MGQVTTIEDTKMYLSEITNNLKIQEKFGLLFDFSAGQPEKERGVLKLENEWFRGYKKEFKEECFGVAMISKSHFPLAIWKNIAACLARRTYGCEVGIFENRTDAQMWLMDKYLYSQTKLNK
ncbi:MAG: hypothetical protein V4585_20110 [Bacteroidota bacterium]